MFTNLTDQIRRSGIAGKIQPARVVDNNDPMKNKRVKFRISGYHRGWTDAQLTWALSFAWAFQGSAGNGVGQIGIPPIGAKIAIFYPEDDDHDAYYIADIDDTTTQVAELLEDYPNSYGWVDTAGNLFLVNTLQKTIRVIHITGTYVKINTNGSLEIGSALSVSVYGTGAVNVRSAVAINCDAPAINLNMGNAPSLTVTPRTVPAPINFSNQVDY